MTVAETSFIRQQNRPWLLPRKEEVAGRMREAA